MFYIYNIHHVVKTNGSKIQNTIIEIEKISSLSKGKQKYKFF